MQHFYKDTQLADVRKKKNEAELEELDRMKRHTAFIREIGCRLGLPYAPIYTALMLYHRFNAKYGPTEETNLVTSCLSLSMKAEETVKKLRDIVQTAIFVVQKKEYELDAKVLTT
jgi:Cyclin, N-terminal domain